MTEPELLKGLLQHDQGAFRALVDQYKDQVYRTSMGLLHNNEDAEDITQDVFIEAYRSIRHFRGQSKISTWLYRITINKSLNLLRKNKIRERFISVEIFFHSKKNESSKDHLPQMHASDQGIENTERSKILCKAISTLPENQRIAFTLHKIEELPHKEIARIMETSVSSVESLIFRAKMNLQKKLSTYYKL